MKILGTRNDNFTFFKMNVYLDIDGVLLANDNSLANYAQEFLSYVLTQFSDTTYWLTTHCQGDAMTPIEVDNCRISFLTIKLA